jgi:hypothetical protein
MSVSLGRKCHNIPGNFKSALEALALRALEIFSFLHGPLGLKPTDKTRDGST